MSVSDFFCKYRRKCLLNSLLPVPTPRGSDLVHLEWLRNLDAPAWQGLTVLDLGCGSGFICEEAVDKGARLVCGLDFVKPEFFSLSSKWKFVAHDLDAPDWSQHLPARSFDVIMAFDILEHVASPYAFLKACSSLMSANSLLFITTPNVGSWERFLKPDSWSGVIDEQHKILFTRYSLNFLLSRVGLSSLKMTAPMRSLAFLGEFQPDIGGQILCKAALKKSV